MVRRASPRRCRGRRALAPDQQTDTIELAFDRDGVLHLAAHIVNRPEPNLLFHWSRPPGGDWSAGENLTPDFLFAGPESEWKRSPAGETCLFFNGWQDAGNGAGNALYLRCLRDGAWTPATQVSGATELGSTADGAFEPDGMPEAIEAVPNDIISFGGTEIGKPDILVNWPRLEVDGDGTLHAAWAAFDQPFAIWTSRSTDSGNTWTAPESLTGTETVDVPWDLVAGLDGDIHLMVPGFPSLYRRWHDGAWGPIEHVPTELGAKRLAVGADGEPVIAWADDTAIRLLRRDTSGAWTETSTPRPAAAAPTRLAIAIADNGAVAVASLDLAGAVDIQDATAPAASTAGFASSVPSPFDINLDPVVVAQSAALAGGVLVLMPFPAQIFNQTIEANYAEISGWFAGLRRRFARRRGVAGEAPDAEAKGFWRGPIGIAAFFFLATLISAFLDPSLALTAESGATVVGLLIGLVVVVLGFSVPKVVLHRRRSHGTAVIEVLPIALPIAVASVAISRLTSFEPGYLYGLLVGVTLVGRPREGEEARSVILSSLWMLLLCVVAWFGLVPVRAALDGVTGALPLLAAQAALATVVTSGLEGLVFGLLPLSVAPGGVLFKQRRRAWALLLGVSTFAFFHILVNPSSGYLVDSSRVPLLTTVALLVLFSAVTAVTWAYFRFRSRRADVPPASPAA